MSGVNREQKAVDEIECPRCHAWPGSPCFTAGKPGPMGPRGPYCHQERRVANQERRRLAGLAGPIELPPGTPNGPPRKSGYFSDKKPKPPQ